MEKTLSNFLIQNLFFGQLLARLHPSARAGLKTGSGVGLAQLKALNLLIINGHSFRAGTKDI